MNFDAKQNKIKGIIIVLNIIGLTYLNSFDIHKFNLF